MTFNKPNKNQERMSILFLKNTILEFKPKNTMQNHILSLK